MLSACSLVQQPGAVDRSCVEALSWDSICGDTKGFANVYPCGAPAERLLVRGSRAAPALLAALDDPVRGVAAHLILTTIFHRDRISPKVRWLDDPKGVQRIPVGVEQQVNGLRWQFHFDTQSYRVNPAELRDNAARWRQELQTAVAS